jgi:glycosyltransferase involved in cell wall biosynthesis
MKIALLHYTAPPVVGGVESVLAQHARLMADAGHSVRIIAGRGSRADPRIHFIHLHYADSQNSAILKLKAELDQGVVPTGFMEMVDMLTESLYQVLSGVDLLIAHNVCSLHKNLPLTAALRRMSAQLTSPKFILWHHDLAWTTPRYRGELHPGYPWDLLRIDWKEARQVAVSELRQQELAELLGVPLGRIQIIPNGLDLSQFLGLSEITCQIDRQYSLREAAPLLLLPVRLTPRKNIELALRTLACLRKLFPAAVLLVSGPLGAHNPANAGYFDELKELSCALGLERSAVFLAESDAAPLPDHVIAELYRLADALFLPSREEGFGLPLLEAGLARLPLFCADIPALRSLAGDYATYFSPDATPESVAAAILGRLESDPLYGMRLRVRQEYSWERIYRQQIAPLLDSV